MKQIYNCYVAIIGLFLVPIGNCARQERSSYGDKVEIGKSGGITMLYGNSMLRNLCIHDPKSGDKFWVLNPPEDNTVKIMEYEWGNDTIRAVDWELVDSIYCEHDWLRLVHYPAEKKLKVVAQPNTTGKKRKLYISDAETSLDYIEIPVIQRGK